MEPIFWYHSFVRHSPWTFDIQRIDSFTLILSVKDLLNCLGLGNFKMDEEFKTFLNKREISVDEYKGGSLEAKAKLVEAFEKSKSQGIIFIRRCW